MIVLRFVYTERDRGFGGIAKEWSKYNKLRRLYRARKWMRNMT